MGHKLLLADDSVTIQRVIELTFADEDIQVVAVSDGVQAIARLESDPPDIVLADVGMPGRDGYDVAAHLKQSARLAHIPVVLLTGAFEPVDQARVAALGCDGVLAKPFEPQLVISRVKELLARERPSPANDAAAGTNGDRPPVESVPVPRTSDSHTSDSHTSDLDRYFDSLDEAFANLSAAPSPRSVGDPQPEPVAPPPPAATRGPSAPEGVVEAPAAADPWVAAGSAVHLHETTEVSVCEPAPPAPAMPVEQGDAAPAMPVGAAGPLPAGTVAAAPTMPAETGPAPLADAFAALLAAEQSGSAWEPVVPSRVASDRIVSDGIVSEPRAWHPDATPASPVVTDELIEHISQRVLGRLSDRVVREVVAEIVTSVAERLVREEIERIKASIRGDPAPSTRHGT